MTRSMMIFATALFALSSIAARADNDHGNNGKSSGNDEPTFRGEVSLEGNRP